MIILREKLYGKRSWKPKDIKDKAIKAVKDNPLTAGNTVLSVGSIGIAVKRSKNEKKFQKEQIDATNELTKAIEENNNTAREVMKKKKKTLKKSQKPYTRDYYLPKPVEDVKDSVEKKLNIKSHD